MVPSLAYRFFNRPIALEARFSRPLVEAFFRPPDAPRPEASLLVSENRVHGKAYDIVSGVAIVPIRGVLVHSSAGWYDELTYDAIAAGIFAALADPQVKAVVLDLCSPGGEVDGCFELCDQIYEARGATPIVAICDPYAYSAAYALASAADWICLPETGGAGSVGVVALHTEISRMLANAGIGVTVFQSGDQKAERGIFAPLSDGAKGRLQGDIDAIGAMFVSRVARNRGLSEAAVRAIEAAELLGAAAVKAGLADEVMAPQEAFDSLLEVLA
jgi:capsid assembly protease